MQYTRFLSLQLILAASFITSSSASAQSPDDEPDYKNMPWHLIDVWWDIGKDQPFESLSIDITISDDIPATTNLYISPIGLGHLSKTPFYGGLQTQSDGNTKADQRLRKIGRGLLMSMWGQRELDAIRPSVGSLLQSSGHEGDFVSVRRPYEWTKGKYTYRITRMDQETIDGKPYTWVGAFVYSHEKDENVFIGALRFPGEKLILDKGIANFVEIYGQRKPVSNIPKVTITFGPPVVNGKAVSNPSATAIYPDGVPDYADCVAKDGSLVVTVGEPVKNRNQRRVKVIEAMK